MMHGHHGEPHHEMPHRGHHGKPHHEMPHRGHHGHGHGHSKFYDEVHNIEHRVRASALHHPIVAGLIAALLMLAVLFTCRCICRRRCCPRRSQRRYCRFSGASGTRTPAPASPPGPPSYETTEDADLDAAIAASLADQEPSAPPAYGELPSAIVQGQVAV